ncbi:VanZ family protein [Halopseudomonas oceani]|uniref:Teicoplanin resistance protein VanZ n=1 Tax=Halopseudomonas oceani TaxID=1708783 RepID=A0A2P4EVH7_9GAMM|nr:VanZ family protein [Halopseudomonas oceani]POB03566.1 teicoplanin resistance protein VanZ [Halopseudomonas oceani]
MRQLIERLMARYSLWFKLAFFALLALGLYLGMSPSPPPTAYSWQASGYHAGGIFALTVLSFAAFPHWRWWFRAIFMTLVGAAVELVQSLHPTRSPDWGDIMANSCGLLVGLLLIACYTLLIRRQRPVEG